MDFTIFYYFIQCAVFLTATAQSNKSSIIPVELLTEYLHYPLTLETATPRFSWKLIARDDSSQNLTQSAYQILVSSVTSGNSSSEYDLWDSGVVQNSNTVHIPYGGKPLRSRQLAIWKVKVWDQKEEISESETRGQFAIGLLHKSDWKAKWIHAGHGVHNDGAHALQHDDQTLIAKLPGLVPPLYFRKSFHLKNIQGARLFSTAKGIYELYLNGKKLHKSHFSPGYTDYSKSFRYQSYEHIKECLKIGENVLGIVVSPGWYAGYLGYSGWIHRDRGFGFFGTDLGVLVQLDINDTTVVATDTTWKVATGPIVYSDFLMGETYYVDKEISGWNDVAFNDSRWKGITVENISEKILLVGDVSEPVETVMTLNPKSMHEPKPGVFIFDFGQNFAGVCSLTIHAGQGPARIQLRHGEVLENPFMSGTLYTANLRSARAIDTLVINDKINQSFTYTPSFTFHGFRFVELTGYGVTPKLSDIVAHVMHSDISFKSHMETSNSLVNRLLLNIQWGLRSNSLSVPTDCPQRDERLGYTGDTFAFAHTAVYNADMAAFYTKWLRDVRESQMVNGALGDTAPVYDRSEGSPGWQDAIILVPWLMYHTYGDEQIIRDNYEAMVKFVDFIRAGNPENIWKNRTDHLNGDWLEVNAQTDHYLMSTAFYAQDALLMSKMAAVIDKTQDSQMYGELFRNISESFNRHYVKADGTVQSDTQAAYALALEYSLLPEKIRPLAAAKLTQNVQKHKMHLTTGFLGVGFLNPALTNNGHNDVAYELLLQDGYPSWLYPVAHANATTIWERWDGWTEEKGFQDAAMNSFNHYSLGSVGVWLYQQVAGIDSDGAGFKHILIKPNPGPGLTSVSATYDSIRGPIASSWIVTGDSVQYKVKIPVNTKATIILPGENIIHQVGSGTWIFNGTIKL